ncbi:polysaccharide pyruvyl transferase family protein [Janibacter alittae]|uniref:Polysaccharide pyruvyl transferase family protein n=1 Tax=Janibacter alittae TaxID=3115209 RepID=A0ABZ2MFC3_9MICO
MKVVVIGDVSWAGQYHLGDEAMTEAAIDQLKRHGADITLVAGDPELSAEYYQVDTIRRLGFRNVPRPKKITLLSTLESALSGEATVPKAMAPAVDAVRRADALVIAGGGNLNSTGEHHLFERLALTRIAEFFDVPLFVSSQSVGPQLSKDDREIVREIADYSVVFGVRERSSAQLMEGICAEPDKVVLTFDDALLIPQMAASSVPETKITLPRSFVVGSFTYHPGATELPPRDYYYEVAAALDHIVSTCDVDIVLIPHMGVLGPGDTNDRDRLGHARIAEFMVSDRVHQLPMISAAQAVSVTSGAQFTVSTRYHPLVFGPAVGVPAVGLVTSHYSMIRMRGALEHVGMSTLAVPYEAWNGLFGPKVVSAISRDREELKAHLDEVGAASIRYQRAWWDGIAARIRGTGEVMTDDVPTPRTYEWGTPADQDSLAVFAGMHEALNRTRNRLALHAQERRRTAKEQAVQHSQLTQEVERLRKDGQRLRDEGRHLEQELAKSTEAAATAQRSLQRQVDEIRYKQRPPGAAIRDGARRRLRRWRAGT